MSITSQIELAAWEHEKRSVTAQAVELNWHDAWKHEPRGAHGEWVAAEGGGRMSGLLGRTKSFFADTQSYRPASQAVTDFAGRSARTVPGLLGGGSESYSGRVLVKDKMQDASTLAVLTWDGDIQLRNDVARGLVHDLAGTGTVENPDNYHTILHELIHGVITPGTSYRDNESAYQDLAHAWIEEGFTELGASQHSEEFFRKMGVGDRPVDGGQTMAELARQRAEDPQPGSWGHYTEQEDIAHSWLDTIAEHEGIPAGPQRQARINELADEMNQVGISEKVGVMIGQIIGVVAGEGTKPSAAAARAIEKDIVESFGRESGQQTAQHAMQAAVAAMAAERAA